MDFVRRTALLRFVAMVALAVSAVLTSDALNPGRAFCPLAEACTAARESILGSFFGVPTSVLGMGAFGALFLITLLPVEWARKLLIPAGVLAALAGAGFVAFQAFVLKTWCPLCLVADGAGFVAGLLTLTWPAPPVRPSGRRLPREPAGTSMAWIFAVSLAVVLPFAWPRTEEPAWVPITPLAESEFGLEPEAAPPAVLAAVDVNGHVAPQASSPAKEDPVPQPVSSPRAHPEPQPVTRKEPLPVPEVTAVARPLAKPQPARALPPSPALAPPLTSPEPAPKPSPKKSRAAPTPKPSPPERPAPTGPLLVEYVNAFCPHCRATHRRLHQVLAEMEISVRLRRVYTWKSKHDPLWARACVYAQVMGCEDRMFGELLRARNHSEREVHAAARRAGINVKHMRSWMDERPTLRRLDRDRRLVKSADIRKLPTIDIGRRRLMGAQSKKELREALRAAVRDRPRN